jgi:hypothetical protein
VCDNGIDDDLDGDIDCADVECAVAPDVEGGDTLDAPFRDRILRVHLRSRAVPRRARVRE